MASSASYGICFGTISLIAPYKTPFCGAIKYLRQIKWRISAYMVQAIKIQIPKKQRDHPLKNGKKRTSVTYLRIRK